MAKALPPIDAMKKQSRTNARLFFHGCHQPKTPCPPLRLIWETTLLFMSSTYCPLVSKKAICVPSRDQAGDGLSAPIWVKRVNFEPSTVTVHKSHGKPSAYAGFANRHNSGGEQFGTRNETPGKGRVFGPDAANKICEPSGAYCGAEISMKTSSFKSGRAFCPSMSTIHKPPEKVSKLNRMNAILLPSGASVDMRASSTIFCGSPPLSARVEFPSAVCLAARDTTRCNKSISHRGKCGANSMPSCDLAAAPPVHCPCRPRSRGKSRFARCLAPSNCCEHTRTFFHPAPNLARRQTIPATV